MKNGRETKARAGDENPARAGCDWPDANGDGNPANMSRTWSPSRGEGRVSLVRDPLRLPAALTGQEP